MRRNFRARFFASSLLVSGLIAVPLAATPAQAQVGVDISFDAFHDQLSNYGDWVYSDRWGEVWRPAQQDQDVNWRPYTVGHWVYTDEYGWTWASDETGWGDVVYHYGRWVFDPDAGWLWMAGYVWSPAWVVWRSAGPNVGWMPMPPDDAFLGFGAPGVGVNVSFGDWGDTSGYYGYSNWYGPGFGEAQFGTLWTFVPTAHVADRDYRGFAVARPQIVNIVRNSRNVTNYTVVNNVIINKSVNITVVQKAAGHAIAPVHAAAALHDTRWVAPVNRGVQVQAQMRQAAPRGNGMANSAPRPTPAQVRTLSTRAIPAKAAGPGGAPHLFTRATAAQIPARGNAGAPRPNAPPPPARPNAPNPAGAPREENRPAAPATGPQRAARPEAAPPNAAPRTAPAEEPKVQDRPPQSRAPQDRAPSSPPEQRQERQPDAAPRQPDRASPADRQEQRPERAAQPDAAPPARQPDRAEAPPERQPDRAGPPQAARPEAPRPEAARPEAARPGPARPAEAPKPAPDARSKPPARDKDDKRPDQ